MSEREYSPYAVGQRVVHIPTGQAGVVVRVYADGLLVEVGRGAYLRYPIAEWRRT